MTSEKLFDYMNKIDTIGNRIDAIIDLIVCQDEFCCNMNSVKIALEIVSDLRTEEAEIVEAVFDDVKETI